MKSPIQPLILGIPRKEVEDSMTEWGRTHLHRCYEENFETAEEVEAYIREAVNHALDGAIRFAEGMTVIEALSERLPGMEDYGADLHKWLPVTLVDMGRYLGHLDDFKILKNEQA